MYQHLLQKISQALAEISHLYSEQIFQFLEWVITKIQLCFHRKRNTLEISKGEIYYVNLGFNIGNEIFKLRPCVVISQKFTNLSDMIWIAPMTSAKNMNNEIKKKDYRYYVFVNTSTSNSLKNDSYIALNQIRTISKTRLDNKIGQLEDIYIHSIDRRISHILGIKKTPPSDRVS